MTKGKEALPPTRIIMEGTTGTHLGHLGHPSQIPKAFPTGQAFLELADDRLAIAVSVLSGARTCRRIRLTIRFRRHALNVHVHRVRRGGVDGWCAASWRGFRGGECDCGHASGGFSHGSRFSSQTGGLGRMKLRRSSWKGSVNLLRRGRGW